ncbi:MAG TPA: PqqD family protein [Pyrinomonadaceae bacterium]|jgi:hypothetical protein
MQKRTAKLEPLARTEGLIVQRLPDEVLVYDLDRHKAHCLNQTAALVWQHCDGEKNVAQIARRLSKEFKTEVGEEVVYLALEQLGKDHLLAERIPMPQQMQGVSRRDLMRRVGLATAVALPIVISIMSPTAAHAVTCIASGSPCSTTVVCCSTLATCTPPATCP